jgi:RNA polymerase sporulation-specific sigma factor
MDVLGSDEDSIVEIVEHKMQVRKLYLKINTCLTSREKCVVEMRYGLSEGKPRTQREIAKFLGISRSYVSRIEKKALKKLYKEMNYGKKQ